MTVSLILGLHVEIEEFSYQIVHANSAEDLRIFASFMIKKYGKSTFDKERTISTNCDGPDGNFSLHFNDSDHLLNLVNCCREVESFNSYSSGNRKTDFVIWVNIPEEIKPIDIKIDGDD